MKSTEKETHRIAIKPLSYNLAYRGRVYPSKELEAYHEELWYALPDVTIPTTGKLKARYVFGLSTGRRSDVDNVIKVFQDVVARKYGFDDSQIYKLDVEKVDVKKGNEFIEFAIKMMPDPRRREPGRYQQLAG